jgi:N-acetyl-1-D-myo-inositol-2-amino-2-deoxy-alpha-D-glucopyranoside deacetylase
MLSVDAVPPRVFQLLTPLSWARADRAALPDLRPAAYGLTVPAPDAPYPPSVVPDDQVTHVVEDRSARTVKNAALRAHRTQVIVATEDLHGLSNRIAIRTSEREGFGRVDPHTWRPVAAGGRPVSLVG